MSAKPSRQKSTMDRPDTTWVPRTLAAGILRPELTLKSFAGLSRRDNTTLTMNWRSAEIGARTGVTSTHNGKKVLDALSAVHVSRAPKDQNEARDETRLIAKVDGGNGTVFKVTFNSIPHDERLELPQAMVWKYKWLGGNGTTTVTGPRYGKDTARVLQWLLAVIAAGQWTRVNGRVVKVVMDLPVVAKTGDRSVSHVSGLSADKYERAFHIAYAHLKDEPWVTVEQTYRPDGGKHTWRITLDYNLLPALMEPPVSATVTETDFAETAEVEDSDPDTLCGVTPAFSAESTSTLSAKSPQHLLRTHREITAVQPLQEEHCSPRTSEATTQTAPKPSTRRPGEEEKSKAQSTSNDPAFDLWVDGLVAGIQDTDNPQRLALTLSDIQRLLPLLAAPYEDGWTPSALAAALTAHDAATVRTVFGALRYRLTNGLPAKVNGEVAPRLSSAKAREQALEDGLMREGAASRTSEKYYWPGTTTVRVTM